MAEQAETHDELDRLLRQGVADMTEGCPSADGTWSNIRSRIERERSAQPSNPATGERRLAAALPAVMI